MPKVSASHRRSNRRLLGGGFAGDQLYADLRDYAQTAVADQPLSSERKLAEEYGISYGTVRKVVDRLVSEELVYKVQGRGVFVSGRSCLPATDVRTILFVDDWGEVDHPYCVRKLTAVLDGTEGGTYRVEVHRAPEILSPHDPEPLVQEARRPEVAGMIVPWMSPAILEKIRQANPDLKIVTGSQESAGPGVGCVLHNRFSFGYQAGAYLLGAGARRLLSAHKPSHTMQGLKARLGEAGGDGELIEVLWHRGDAVESIVAQVLAGKPDGLVFTDDRMAMAVIQALQQQAPERVAEAAIVSSANTGEDYLPAFVAKLEQDGYEVGMVAMALLKAMIEGRPVERPVMMLEPRLVPPKQTADEA